VRGWTGRSTGPIANPARASEGEKKLARLFQANLLALLFVVLSFILTGLAILRGSSFFGKGSRKSLRQRYKY
jgi:hypothetical protein